MVLLWVLSRGEQQTREEHTHTHTHNVITQSLPLTHSPKVVQYCQLDHSLTAHTVKRRHHTTPQDLPLAHSPKAVQSVFSLTTTRLTTPTDAITPHHTTPHAIVELTTPFQVVPCRSSTEQSMGTLTTDHSQTSTLTAEH